MNDIKKFCSQEFGEIRVTIINGEPWFVGKDVAAALGYSDTKSAIRDHIDEDDRKIVQRGQITTLEIPNRGMTIINESGVYSLIFGSRLEGSKRFKHWVTSEVLPQIRKIGTYSTEIRAGSTENSEKFSMCLYGIKFLCDDLRLAESSRLFMYENAFKEFDIPSGFLPHYEDNRSRERCSATELLKRNGCEMSAAKFNQLMISAGYLEIKERRSSKGVMKPYKSLTESGLKYGVNLISDKNQKESQPYYYSDTFMGLFDEVNK